MNGVSDVATRTCFKADQKKKLIDSLKCECYKRAKVTLYLGLIATMEYDILEAQ
jgi:hypothetical protein